MPDLGRVFRAVAAIAALGIAAFAAEAADRFWPPIVDPPTGQHTPGRWVWGDLVTSDVAVAADFYGQVFGWTFETYGGENDLETYTLALADGLPIGGLVFDQRALKDKVPSARWIGLISVPDVRAAADAVTRAGGKVMVAPVMLGERGETAVFQDPEGTPFGVVRSRNGDPADYAGDVNEWVWLDLWTGDVGRAADFYRTVVGYEVLPLQQEGLRKGVHLVSGGFVRAGIMQKNDAREHGRVAALPARRRRGGGRQQGARRRGQGHSRTGQPRAGIVAIIADPTGAPVGVAQLLDQEAQR